MELFMPSKEDWEEMQKNIAAMTATMRQFNNLMKNGSIGAEHFPEFMDIPIAAKYLKCPVSRIKSMLYIQKLLQVHHIDLTTTVYVSKKEMDELPCRVIVLRKMEKKNLHSKP